MAMEDELIYVEREGEDNKGNTIIRGINETGRYLRRVSLNGEVIEEFYWPTQGFAMLTNSGKGPRTTHELLEAGYTWIEY